VGCKRIVMFDTIGAVQMSLRITENVGVPLVRLFEAYYVEGDNKFLQFAEDKVLVKSVSTGKPAKASEYHSKPYSPNYINDGNPSTRWATNVGSDQWWVEIDLEEVTEVDQVSIVEGWGRIQDFKIECSNSEGDEWTTVFKGTTVGANYSRKFGPVEARYFRLNILKSTEEPTIWEWQLYSTNKTEGWHRCRSLKPDEIKKGECFIDASDLITTPGQYLLRLDGFGEGNSVKKVSLLYNDDAVMDAMVTRFAPGLYNINHTAATTKDYKVRIRLEFTTNIDGRHEPEVFIKRAYE
ncbi:MAG: discoidin domain-containing protein, partial [Anaerohalosphaera sp.]|nr:discoidin domain-containing protein [Anaerohalosphaera sp.]